MRDSESLVFAAERVVSILDEYRIDAVLIGAVALAAYHYVRHTEDVALGVSADLAQMRALTVSLATGYRGLKNSSPLLWKNSESLWL